MTRQTIKLIDRYCSIKNWQSSIDTSVGNPFYQTTEEGKRDIASWSARRDLEIAKFRLLMIGLTDHEKVFLRRRVDWLAPKTLELGIEPNWT